MKGPIAAVDLRSLATLVGHREVVGINGRNAPLPELDEAVTKCSEVRITGSEGHLCDTLAAPGHGLSVQKARAPISARPGVQGAIPTVDLARPSVDVRHQEVAPVRIPKPEISQLHEPR